MSSAHLKLSACCLGSCTLVHSNLHTAPGASHRIPSIKLLETAIMRTWHSSQKISHRKTHCLTQRALPDGATELNTQHTGPQGIRGLTDSCNGPTGHSELLTHSKSLCSQRAPLAHAATTHNVHHIALTEALRTLCIHRCSKAFTAEQHTWTAFVQMIHQLQYILQPR